MGFGTGHHATTRLMLKALQRLNLHDRDLLDIGCGSGVLTIAGVALGGRSAMGIDTDPDALQSAAENLSLNRVADRVRLQQGDFRELSTPSPIVLANLTGALLEQSASHLAQLVEPGGYLVVSGFMALVFMLASVLVANPCGAFGDSCDDYGTTSTELIVMLALTCLSFGGVIVGVVLVASSLRRRR